jgi:hypothetical protein
MSGWSTRKGSLTVLVMAAVIAMFVQDLEALPLSADAVVSESQWTPPLEGELRGQDGLEGEIARRTHLEEEQRRRDNEGHIFSDIGAMGVLKTALKNQVDGTKVLDEFTDVQEEPREDLLSGISHDADVIDDVIEKAQAAVEKPSHTLVMHVKDGKPLVAVEASTQASTQAVSKADVTKADVPEKAPYSNYEKELDAQQKVLIDKEMKKPLDDAQPDNEAAQRSERQNAKVALSRDLIPPPAKHTAPTTEKKDAAKKPPKGKAAAAAQPIIIHGDGPLVPTTHRQAGDAASVAVTAATKAVGTLEDLKASADAAVAAKAPPAPSPARVHEKIMEEATASAAKTIAKLEKKEAAAQKSEKSGANSLLFAPQDPVDAVFQAADADLMSKFTAKYLADGPPIIPPTNSRMSEEEIEDAKTQAVLNLVHKERTKFGGSA